MNILQIPDGEEIIALQRFLNLIAFNNKKAIQIGDKNYNVTVFRDSVYFVCKDTKESTGMAWELVIPQVWHDQLEYDEIRSFPMSDERQFVADFFDFIEDYQEVV